MNHSHEYSWVFPKFWNKHPFLFRKSHLQHNITKLNGTKLCIFPFPSNILVAGMTSTNSLPFFRLWNHSTETSTNMAHSTSTNLPKTRPRHSKWQTSARDFRGGRRGHPSVIQLPRGCWVPFLLGSQSKFLAYRNSTILKSIQNSRPILEWKMLFVL